MEEELAKRTLLGVAAIRELGGNLAVAMETQQALADEVSPLPTFYCDSASFS